MITARVTAPASDATPATRPTTPNVAMSHARRHGPNLRRLASVRRKYRAFEGDAVDATGGYAPASAVIPVPLAQLRPAGIPWRPSGGLTAGMRNLCRRQSA